MNNLPAKQTACQSLSNNHSIKESIHKPWNRLPNAIAIAKGVDIIPKDWSLTPLNGKQPYRENWQGEDFIPHSHIKNAITAGVTATNSSGKEWKRFATGYGLRTGNGFVAIDIDGSTVHAILEAISGGDVPKTLSWTSGKPGRYQMLFYIPNALLGDCEGFTKTVFTHFGDLHCASGEQLEIRYERMQSCLPPSMHPETGSYRWINSPADTEVAEAPAWLCEIILNAASAENEKKSGGKEIDRTQFRSSCPQCDRTGDDLVDFLNWEVLPRLSPEQIFNWSGHNFRQYGKTLKGQPYGRQSASGKSFHVWMGDDGQWAWQDKQSRAGGGAIQYRWMLRGGTGTPKGRDWVDVVRELANDAGVEMPENNYKNGGKPTGKVMSGSTLRVLRGGGSGSGNDGNPPSDASLRDRVRDILAMHHEPEAQSEAFILLASEYRISVSDVRNLAKELQSQTETIEWRDESKQSISEIISLQASDLSLYDYLPKQLADPLAEYCKRLNLRHETVFLALLTATSSLHKVGTELVMHRTQGFSVPPIIYGGVVMESGQKKSPITRQIVSKPLNILKRKIKDHNQTLESEYLREKAEWSEADKDTRGEEPQEPRKECTTFFFTDANGEGIKAHAQEYPDKSQFALVDELAGFFNSANKYTNGRGSDRQDGLSYFDGWGATVLRSSGIKVDVERIYLSIFGGIQPDIIRSIMRDSTDPDGQWARFLFVQQPLVESELTDDDGSGIDVTEYLAGVYSRLYDLPKTEYKLSRDAFKMYQPFYNWLEKQRVSNPSPGLRAVYAKAEGYTGRLALNLHVLHDLAIAPTSVPTAEIPASRMKQAIELMKFFIGQSKLLYSSFDDGIAPHISKMLQLSQHRESTTGGWIKAKDVQLSTTKKQRPTPDTIRSWMREAEAMGFGETRGTGIKLEFRYVSNHFNNLVGDANQKVDDFTPKVGDGRRKVDDLVDGVLKPETTTINTSQLMVDKKVDDLVDGVDILVDDFEPSKFTHPQNLAKKLVDGEKANRLPKSPNVDTPVVFTVDDPSTNRLLSSTKPEKSSTEPEKSSTDSRPENDPFFVPPLTNWSSNEYSVNDDFFLTAPIDDDEDDRTDPIAIAETENHDRKTELAIAENADCDRTPIPFKVGDRVASKDPESPAYHWKGRITRMHPEYPESCYVDFPEREKAAAVGRKPGEREISMRFERLRKLED